MDRLEEIELHSGIDPLLVDTILANDTCPRGWPRYEREIHIHETDKDGVVHFSNYFKIGEEAMLSGFRRTNCVLENSEFSLAMIKATTEYIRPLKFGDRVIVELAEVIVQRAKFMLTFNFDNPSSESLAKVRFTLVTITAAERKAVPIPAIINNSLSIALAKLGAEKPQASTSNNA